MPTNLRGAPPVADARSRSAGGKSSPAATTRGDDRASGAAMNAGKSAIVVIDQRVLIRDCLVRCLGTATERHVALAFGSVAEWLAAGTKCPPAGLIVLCVGDRRHPDIHRDRDLSLLSRRASGIPFVLIAEADDLEDVVAALESGARGYVPTSVTLDVALEAMRLIEAGGTFVPASCLFSLSPAGAFPPAQKRDFNGLFTRRQTAVLDALRHGKPNKLIAHELDMREGTVKVHVRNIMKKLKAKNRTEVAVLTSGLLAEADGG
jgi:DNA-binding NarL/FixJ family response regulator